MEENKQIEEIYNNLNEQNQDILNMIAKRNGNSTRK